VKECRVATTLTNKSEIDVAASVAPEDLRCGDLVGIQSVIYQYPSFFWCADSALERRHELVRIRYILAEGGIPLKIKAICLPFVFVKDPAGNHRHLDTRLYRLVRLTSAYSQEVWKAMRKKQKAKA
jgi:hypothetical protein